MMEQEWPSQADQEPWTAMDLGVTPGAELGLQSRHPQPQSARTWELQYSWTQNCSDSSCILSFFTPFVFIEVSCTRLFVTPWTIQSMEFSRPEYWSGQPFLSPGDLPNSGIEPRSPALQEDSLPAEPQRKPKNTGVGNLSLLQGIFLTQKLNQGLLHCRWILYQPSYEEGKS